MPLKFGGSSLTLLVQNSPSPLSSSSSLSWSSNKVFLSSSATNYFATGCTSVLVISYSWLSDFSGCASSIDYLTLLCFNILSPLSSEESSKFFAFYGAIPSLNIWSESSESFIVFVTSVSFFITVVSYFFMIILESGSDDPKSKSLLLSDSSDP